MSTGRGNLSRGNTINNLLSKKVVGKLGALCLLFNAATGPGLPFAPQAFQNPGYVFSSWCYVIFMFVSGFSILLTIESIQAIPGNKHFQGNVEYATMINFYFGSTAHIVGQIFLYGCLQSNSIQGIVLSAQAIDKLLIDIFGKTCGLVLSGSATGWQCVRSAGSAPSPFGNDWVLGTTGLFAVLVMIVPLGLSNLDDNLWVQYVAFAFSLMMVAEWDTSSALNGFAADRVRALGGATFNSYQQVVGTVMLNFAITTIVPSWINIKNKNVNVQKTVWGCMLFIGLAYISTGVILGLGFDKVDANVLHTLLSGVKTQWLVPLTKVTVYGFAFIFLIPSVPVNLIISYQNLVQNNLTNQCKSLIVNYCLGVGMILSYVVPLACSIPLLTGDKMQAFQNWTSLIFVSTSNFIIPVLIYFQCIEFRRNYNEKQELNTKQYYLLKIIHSNSKSMVKQLNKREESDKMATPFLTTPENSLQSVRRAHTTTLFNKKIDFISRKTDWIQEDETTKVERPFWMIDDVPDPDVEPYEIEIDEDQSFFGFGRQKAHLAEVGQTRAKTDPGGLPLSETESPTSIPMTRINTTNGIFAKDYEEVSLSSPSDMKRMSSGSSEHSLDDINEDKDIVRSQKTLKVNPQFKTPVFH
ncbi:hypothetical protein BC833DRAFT_571884, partial [Globomyces pollinis-pini]